MKYWPKLGTVGRLRKRAPLPLPLPLLCEKAHQSTAIQA